MTSRSNCRHYGKCSAPLCPLLSEEENKKGLWYPEEEICRRRKYLPEWVRQQRKIAAKAAEENYGFYYTLEMLMVPFRVTKSVKGLDPNRLDEKKQLAVWFKRYRGVRKRKLSAKQRDQKRRLIAHARKVKDKSFEPIKTQKQ